jgi:hypothetical protein
MMRFLRRSSMEDKIVGGDEATPEPQQGTRAALLTASLSTVLAEAVSGLVGTAYAARILRIEPRVHGGAEIIVEFLPRPSEHTLKIELGEERVEVPLPPGVVVDPTV